MTEEIIIDCAFYKDGVCASPINKTCEYCKNIDVSKCYHKQLKRLEQENNTICYNLHLTEKERDELKQENETIREHCKQVDETNNILYKEKCDLIQENEKLKEKLKSRENELANMAEQANMRINKYRSALEEINILAKNYCNACDEFKVKTFKNKNDCFYCNYGFIKRKINEVLNEN